MPFLLMTNEMLNCLVQNRESESWTLPVSIDDSNVQLVSEIPEARQYRYGMTRETVFQARGQAAKNK